MKIELMSNKVYSFIISFFSFSGGSLLPSSLIQDSIRYWAAAIEKASENPTLLLKHYSEKIFQECASRMNALDNAENYMLDLMYKEGPSLTPSALKLYSDARQNMDCPKCRFSSSMPEHPECKKKIDRFFRAKENLIRYAKMID